VGCLGGGGFACEGAAAQQVAEPDAAIAAHYGRGATEATF
jgi:hypothetical protein